MEKGFYKRFSTVGPGGKRCSCCYPPPGKFRRLEEKKVKRTEKQESKKKILQDLELIADSLTN